MQGHNEDISTDNDAMEADDEYDDILTVFHASPLVSISSDDDGAEVTPLDVSSMDREHQNLQGIFEKTTARIRMDHCLCTPDGFQAFLEDTGKRVLHFACHASDGKLYLEKEMGKVSLVPISELAGWVKKGTQLDLVVVADHDTEVIAEAFEGVVPHIVCCPVLKHKLDEAALVFCKTFYSALANLSTVGGAFREARDAVENSTHLSYTDGRQEVGKYRLLPEDGDHDVVLFHKNGKKVPALDFPPSRILPAPPPIFVGRQKDVYQLILDLESARLIRITGNLGIGAATIVKSACQYMVQRREHFPHEIIWLPPRLGQMDGLTSLSLRVFETVVKLEPPAEKDLVALVNILKKRKVLIVCDVREWESKDVYDGLMDFLDEIFDVTDNTRAVILHETIDLGNSAVHLSSSYVEKCIRVKPLGYTSTVSLFGLLCPHVAKRTVPSITTVDDFKKLLVPVAGYAGSANLKMTIVNIYNLLGSGNAARMQELALSMTSEEYQSLVQVGKLRQKLSRLYQKQIEMAFPTRYSLDSHLAELSEAIEDARDDRKLNDVQIFEAKFAEAGRRRPELPSVDTMLIKRKALKSELKFAKLSSPPEEAEPLSRSQRLLQPTKAERISEQIGKLEKTIKRERKAMIEDEEDWIRVNYIEYPRGISRRSLEMRYTAKEHLLTDARKTKDYRLARELEFPLKELRECKTLLLSAEEWGVRREELDEELKQAQREGDVEKIVKLNDQEEEIDTRLEDEEGEVDFARIADDLFLSLNGFLRHIGDGSVEDLPVFESLASRAEASACLTQIESKAQVSSDAMNMDRYNTLVGLYKEVCGIIAAKFPSIESLLVERQGLKLEKKLVFSDDQEIVKAYEVEIKGIEVRVVQERKALGPHEFYGVSKSCYLQGVTRRLVDELVQQLQRSLEEANDEENVFEMASLEVMVAELVKHQDKLPNVAELAALVERTEKDLEMLSGREGKENKRKIMEAVLIDLRNRRAAEVKPEDRPQEDIADELMILKLDYFHPPSSDSFVEIKNEDQYSMDEDQYSTSEDEDEEGYLSTVDEQEGENSSVDE